MHFRDTSRAPVAADVTLDPLGHAASATAPLSHRVYRRIGKRCLDVGLVLISAPAVLLIVGILALLVARRGGQPFYAQMRVGQGGRLYRMWKLRTMVTDADARLEAYLEANPEARSFHIR